MNQKGARLIAGIFVLFLATIACSLLPAAAPTPAGPDALYTQAAQTVSAQLTQMAVNATPTQLPPATLPPATETGVPQATATPTATQAPPTQTQVPPTPTPVPPTPTPTPIPCNWAQFIEDVSVKDGTEFTPNSIFNKTWRLKNIGTCSWTGDYHLEFVDGDRMDGPRSISLSETVDPGETIDLSVELVAPDEPDRYRGYWQLSNASGDLFGIGSSAEEPFWVEINVVESDQYGYDFRPNYCAAKWYSDAGRLECPGRDGDEDGWVQVVDRPLIEDNRRENEPALVMSPEDEENGFIQGEFPGFDVEAEDHFKAVVGCMSDRQDCDVIIQLNYRIGDGEAETLWETREVYDDSFTRVDVDLSSFEGEEVQFFLAVLANGSPDDDEVFWLAPRIVDISRDTDDSRERDID